MEDPDQITVDLHPVGGLPGVLTVGSLTHHGGSSVVVQGAGDHFRGGGAAVVGDYHHGENRGVRDQRLPADADRLHPLPAYEMYDRCQVRQEEPGDIDCRVNISSQVPSQVEYQAADTGAAETVQNLLSFGLGRIPEGVEAEETDIAVEDTSPRRRYGQGGRLDGCGDGLAASFHRDGDACPEWESVEPGHRFASQVGREDVA